MHRINIYIRDDQDTKLRKISSETGIPVAELIRRAIKSYMEKGVVKSYTPKNS